MQLEYLLMRPEGYVCVQEEDEENGIPAKYEPVYVDLGYIDYIKDNVTFKLNSYDELELEIPKYVQDPMNGFQRKLNPVWDLVRDEYVIEVSNNISDERQRFVITKIDSESEGTATKPIEAMSLEYEYCRKQMRNFTSQTIDENYLDIDKPQYLKDILEHINTTYMDNTWAVGYIDSNVAVKMRTYDYSEGSVYGFFSKLQESFCCVFKFDTINRLINVYDLTIYPVCPKCHKSEYLVFYDSTLECYNPNCYIDVDVDNEDLQNMDLYGSDGTILITEGEGENQTTRTVLAKDGAKVNWKTTLYGRDTELYLHEKNYIAKFSETSDTDEMATRLYVYGKDDLGINTATENYSGQAYIDDLSYYRDENYMSSNLLEALNRYDDLYESCAGEWVLLNDEHYNLIRQLSKATVISTDGESLLENLQIQINAVKAMTSLQANGYSTATLDELEELLKDYWNEIEVDIDSDNSETLHDLLKSISYQLEEISGDIVDLAEAIEVIIDGVEEKFSLMKEAIDNAANDETIAYLSKYSLEQLEEALNVYNARIKVLVDISNNIVSADVDSELTTGSVWEEGDQIYYRLIQEDVDKGTAETEWDNFNNPYTLTTKATSGFWEIELPSEYTKAERTDATCVLQVWLAKQQKDTDGNGTGKYEDRILQTEDVQYYVLETGNSSGSIYKIRQNSIDLTVIKTSLESAIEKKKEQIAAIEELQAENDENIAALKVKLAKETATYTDETTGEKKLIFPTELILEMNKFIKEQIYTNDTIGVADIVDDTQTDLYKQRVDELYQEGLTVLDTKHTPSVEFTIDIVNFLRDIRYQRDWDKISLGDMIHVGHIDASSDDYIVRIIEFSWSNSDTKLNLTLSNEDRLKSSDALVHQLIKDTVSTNATLSVKKEQWNNAQSNAVDEILNNGWDAAISAVTCGDNVNVTVNEQGITLTNPLKPEIQMRLTDDVLAFTDDNWNTTRTAISNGNVLADVIVGRFLVGKDLQIVATKEDGTTLTFRVNGDGVKIDNGSLTILAMSGSLANTNGITLSPDPYEGFICTSFDDNGTECFEIKINGQDGIKMYTLDSNGEADTVMFYAKPNGTLLANGIIYAKDLCLGAINNQSVVTYIDKSNGTVNNYTYEQIEKGVDNNGNEINTKQILSALQGKHISCAGLNISTLSGSFAVDSNGCVTMKNSDITITDSSGNKLVISAATPFTVTNSDNQTTAQLLSNGNLSITGELATGFTGEARMVINGSGINSYNENNQIDGLVINPNSYWSSLSMYRNGNEIFSIEVEASGACYIQCKGKTVISMGGNLHTLMNGTWYYRDSEIATKADIEDLQNQINSLKNTSTNPII